MTVQRRPALLALAPLLAILASCDDSRTRSPATEPDGALAPVAVADAWCRPSPNAARVGACYLTLTAAQDDRLTAVSSPASATVEIHDMSMDGGVMRMSEMEDGLPLPAGQPQALAPGGKHLMMMGLVEPLAEGATVSLTLRFDTAHEQTIDAQVRQPEAGDGHQGH